MLLYYFTVQNSHSRCNSQDSGLAKNKFSSHPLIYFDYFHMGSCYYIRLSNYAGGLGCEADCSDASFENYSGNVYI